MNAYRADVERQHGAVTPRMVAEWETRRYAVLRRYATAGRLDELLPVDMTASPVATVEAIGRARVLGLF